MKFNVYPLREEGRLLPTHVRWAGKVTGDLLVADERDAELNRVVRVARIVREGGAATTLLGPLLDAVLVGARPAWWTMTGWERSQDGISAHGRAYQQSWLLIPEDEDST